MKLPQGLTQKIGRTILTMKKDSPRMLFVAGIGGILVSTVLACRSTLKLGETLDEFEKDIQDVKILGETIPPQGRVRTSYNSDLAYVYAKGTIKIIRLYAPAVIIGSASIGALAGSHVTLMRRNASLTAAYSALQVTYDAYRDRVRDEIGEEKELDIHRKAVVQQLAVDSKVAELRRKDPNKWSIYARFFDEYNQNWKKDAELNRLFINAQQNYANHLLHARGHLFLNEVYDMLDLGRTKAGQVVGWVVGNGDNFVDFGLYEPNNEQFINGWERSILLDFNVDGVVYDQLG